MKEETTEKEQQTEKEEAERLTNKCLQFVVNYETEVIKGGEPKTLLGRIKALFKKAPTEKKEVRKTFTLQEPTLAVLDLLSAEFIGLDIDLAELTKGGNDTLAAAKRLANKHAKNAAKIAAIATLGESCFRHTKNGYTINSKLIESRTDFFFHVVKPSELNDLCSVITGVCNLGNFINSMVLMSASRTTGKKTIE